MRAAQEKNLAIESVEDFANVSGKGVKGRMENAAVLVGNARLMRDEGVELGETLAQIEAPPGEGGNRRGRAPRRRGHRSHRDCRHAEERRQAGHR